MARIDDAVLSYLRENPGAKPRAIADALGVSLAAVRYALLRLRDKGLVVRTQRGYVAVAAPRELVSNYRERAAAGRDLREAELEARLAALEARVADIEARLRRIEEMLLAVPGRRMKRFEEALLEEKVLPLERARSLPGYHGVSYYVERGEAVVVGRLIVEKGFYEEFRSRFPIRVEDVSRLGEAEKMLLEAMVSEGMAYLHGGREYRLA